MLKLMVLVAVLGAGPRFREVEVPKKYVQGFFYVDDSSPYYYSIYKSGVVCKIVLKQEFSDEKVLIFDRDTLFTKEDCQSVKERFFKE